VEDPGTRAAAVKPSHSKVVEEAPYGQYFPTKVNTGGRAVDTEYTHKFSAPRVSYTRTRKPGTNTKLYR
jgi:hypothetical protein